MTTKELIQAEIDTLSEEDLDELYALIKHVTQSKQSAKPQSLLAALRCIQVYTGILGAIRSTRH